MTIASLTGTRTWLTDPLTPGGAAVVCGSRRDGQAADAIDGELVQYAGFRTELESYDSGTLTLPITFAGLTGAQLAQITAWKGRTLLLRTIDGQRYYGGYLAVSVTTYLLAGPLYDASVQFQTVSYTDTV